MSRLTGLLDPETRAYFEAIDAAVRPGRHQPDAGPNSPTLRHATTAAPANAATTLLTGDRSRGEAGRGGSPLGQPAGTMEICADDSR